MPLLREVAIARPLEHGVGFTIFTIHEPYSGKGLPRCTDPWCHCPQVKCWGAQP